MDLLDYISLKPFNTFGIDVQTRYFAEASSEEEVIKLAGNLREDYLPLLILGGGSNILFTKDFDGLVLKNNVGRIKTIKEDKQHVYIRVGAGENWHEFVLRAQQALPLTAH